MHEPLVGDQPQYLQPGFEAHAEHENESVEHELHCAGRKYVLLAQDVVGVTHAPSMGDRPAGHGEARVVSAVAMLQIRLQNRRGGNLPQKKQLPDAAHEAQEA